MSLPRSLLDALAWPFAAERMDTWVLKVSIGILLACIACLGLWHLLVYLSGKLPKKPRKVRYSPEPPAPARPPNLLPRSGALADVAAGRDDPEQLQQACTALEESLAQKYLELAQSWLRRNEPQKAAAVCSKIVQRCPESRQAQLARDLLQQMGKEIGDHPS